MTELLQRLLQAAPDLTELTDRELIAVESYLKIRRRWDLGRYQRESRYKREWDSETERRDFLRMVCHYNRKVRDEGLIKSKLQSRASAANAPSKEEIKRDAEIAREWQSGKFKRKAELAQKLGMETDEVIAAIERDRKRQPGSRTTASEKKR
jgi:hypothetical protein